MKSRWEEMLAGQLDKAGIAYEREWRLLKGRKFRADFLVRAPRLPIEDHHEGLFRYARAWGNTTLLPDGDHSPFYGALVEVNGQGPQGRHGSYGHAESDAEKLSAAACLGYRVLVVTGKQVASGLALAWIRCALGIEGDPERVFARPQRKSRPRPLQAARKPRLSGRCVTSGLPERVKRAAGLS
jgi:hypothetical protein